MADTTGEPDIIQAAVAPIEPIIMVENVTKMFIF